MYKNLTFRLFLFLVISVFITGTASDCFAVKAEQQKREKWQTAYTGMLEKQTADPEEKKAILKEAVTKALDGDAPACEVMRIAIGMDYKPYFVMRYIYEHSQGVKIDELCWCATSDGIEYPIISKAVTDAQGQNSEPVFRKNEIAKAECLRQGLAYTAELNSPDPITPPGPPPPNPRSPTVP